ncbi:helix-turn-helix transcriptional regulator [Nocardia sp. NPDC059091]|uniref:helix-turn-helix transcriptional regulator n=1 Tax=unclassified Nocardia TaxID=2637762 RepID=UPI00369BAFB6
MGEAPPGGPSTGGDMRQDVKHQLIGRFRELDTLDRLVREVRDGHSAVLVLRGEAGVGKSALLDHLAAHANHMQTVRTAGVEAEADFAYSALQRLCAPLLPHLDRLPQVHQDALRVAFGLSAGNPPEMLLVGMAVLGLLAEAASEVPLLCLIDDAQWLDLMSQRILAFVARRLDTESVAMVFAVRATDVSADEGLSGLPDLPIRGLADADARALLDSALPGPIDARVRDRIVAETSGNPLALLELPRGLSPTELAFGFGGPGGAPLATRVEDGFRRRIDALPPDTRTLLLVAAVEPVGDGPLLWRALGLLGIGLEAAAPAEAADLITLSAPVRFRHPLVRSALWRGADAATLRAAHRALAEATDEERDPDRRAWHQAHAAVGPDEQVAAALERSADRALARGGRAAAASFLERAAALSPDRDERARRALAAAGTYLAAGVPSQVPDLLAAAELSPLDRLHQAEATRLRALASYMAKPGLGAVQSLLAATTQLQDVAPAAARETCLSALGAAMWAGRVEPDGLRLTVETARSLPPGDDTEAAFLRAFVTWSTDGSGAAAPFLRKALDEYAVDGEAGVLWLAVAAAVELGDLQTCLSVTERAATTARATGTLSLIPTSLTYRIIALIHAGRFSETRDLLAEAAAAEESMRTSGSTVTPAMLSAYRGRERQAVSSIEMMERDGRQRGLGRLLGVAGCARAVLHNGLGNYSAALEAARSALEFRDFALHHWALCELVEAAVRVGEHSIAAEARDQLADWAETATPWAKGARALAEALTEEPGATERSEERYREAIDHFGEGGLGVLEARTRLLLGEWLRRRNRRAQARIELRTAHQAFVTMDMEAFAERARRELLATGETVRKRTVDTPDLTPQETQIARLAAAGHANAEIGAELFISPRTVEWHLRKVFTKLGVSSRRELDSALSPR